MSNVLKEEKQQQVLVLGRLGWSLRRIEQRTGVRRETASAYLKAAGIAVRGRGRWGQRGASSPTNEPPTDSTAAKPANEVSTDSGEQTPENPQPQPANPAPTASACEPYRETIELWLSRGRNATAIWQDLVDQHGYSDGYQTVKRFVRKLRGRHSPQAVGIILTAPGEEAQVDYGTGPMAREEKSGKYRRTRLFVMTLCIGILNHLFSGLSNIAGPGELSIPFLLDENPDVASAGSGGAAVGGARSVPDHAARSNSERAAPSARVGNRFSAPQIVWNAVVAALNVLPPADLDGEAA